MVSTEQAVDVPDTMNSVRIVARGEYGFGQCPVPKPGDGQVLIKVHSCPINPSDILFMRGKFGVEPKYPFTPGWEGSGTVIASGPGMFAEWVVGKRVAFMKQSEAG